MTKTKEITKKTRVFRNVKTVKKGGLHPCSLGSKCPYKLEYQHQLEFSHDTEPSKVSFPDQGYRLNAGTKNDNQSQPIGRVLGAKPQSHENLIPNQPKKITPTQASSNSTSSSIKLQSSSGKADATSSSSSHISNVPKVNGDDTDFDQDLIDTIKLSLISSSSNSSKTSDYLSLDLSKSYPRSTKQSKIAGVACIDLT